MNLAIPVSAFGVGLLSGHAITLRSPTLQSVYPNQGVATDSVTLTGTGFLAGATVTFGGVAATSVVVASSTSITCVVPTHALGAVDVVVTNTDTGTGTLASGFTYMAALSVGSVSPTTGQAGTSVTITGTGFMTGATVTFGGVAATSVVVASSTTMTCVISLHAAGAVDVVVTNPNSRYTTMTSGFTYTTSVVTVGSVSPYIGMVGASATITGSGFLAGATVTFGGVAATSVVVASSTTITCVVPTHAAGAVDVVVTNTDTGTGTLASGFTYVTTLTVTDAFNGTGALSANWTVTNGGWNQIGSGQVFPTVSGASDGARWTANAFNANQYSEVVLGALSSLGGDAIGPAVRVSSAGDYYCLLVDGGNWFLQRYAGGVFQGNIATAAATFAVGDTVHLEISGTTLTAKHNGATLTTQTDTNLAIGAVGIASWGASGGLDSWIGGDL